MARITAHPGEVLKEEFLAPLRISARALAAAIRVTPNRVTSILNKTQGVTADTAIRLGKVFGTSSEFWLNLQVAHDLSKAQTTGDFSGIGKVAKPDVLKRRRAV